IVFGTLHFGGSPVGELVLETRFSRIPREPPPSTFNYARDIAGRFLEVVTFEVKPFSTVDVASVYEALAHRRASTRAYVVLHVPEERERDIIAAVEATCEEAKRHGIGVIVATRPDSFDHWDVRYEAERFEPDPSRLNEFIAQQLSEGLKEQIIRWFK
ncbi:hypothetical protein, partial [Burkholderia cenocepacia]|uniref:hypothetical protein n=1 Tax=Burkholderia cenocepacia TaxID=95486 RepID=UPI001BA1040C